MNIRILSTMLVFVITISSSVLVFAIPSISQSSYARQEEVQLVDSRLQYGEIENEITEIENKIYDLNTQIEPLQLTAEKNKKEIEDITMIIDNTKKDIEQCKKEINKLDFDLGQRVKAIYVSGDFEFNYLSFVFESESTSDFFTRVQAVSKIVGKDKLAIENIDKKKKEVDTKINSLQEKKDEIYKLNTDIKDTLSKLDGKKKEQEALAKQAKTEKSKFDSDYLSKLELNAVSYQFNIIDNENSSSEEILGAIDQLVSIRDNQIKSPLVSKEINEKIEKGKAAAQQKKLDEDNNVVSNTRPRRNKSGSSVPVPEAGKAQAILNEAYKHLGKDYVWGATGIQTFDCSGFTQYVYNHAAGIEISRTTYTQINKGQEVSEDELEPGDLVFPHTGHVGIYVGNGQMIHAPHTGDVIKVGPLYEFYEARRIL